MTTYLTVEEVIFIHDFIHACPVRDLTALQSAVDRPSAAPWGQEQYVTIHEKAASLLFGLAHNHPFMDANKRTCWVATVLFLSANGVRVKRMSDEIGVQFVVSVLEQQLAIEDITLWLIGQAEPAL